MTKSNNNSKNNDKGISRIDSGSTHGWFVRGYKNGKTYSKLFSDRKHGSKEAALKEARKFRDSLMDNLKTIPKKPRGRRLVYGDSRNNTGVVGVTRVKKKSKTGKVTESYSVTWRPEPGVQKCTSFSIAKYGEEKAFELAVALRKEKMKEIYGEDVHARVKKHVNNNHFNGHSSH